MVLEAGEDPRNGTAIIDKIRGRSHQSRSDNHYRLDHCDSSFGFIFKKNLGREGENKTF